MVSDSDKSYTSSDDEDLDFSKSSDEEWAGDSESSSSDDTVQKWVKSVQLLPDTDNKLQLVLFNCSWPIKSRERKR